MIDGTMRRVLSVSKAEERGALWCSRRIDIITGTLGKALVVHLGDLPQVGRKLLPGYGGDPVLIYSRTLAPVIAATSITALICRE